MTAIQICLQTTHSDVLNRLILWPQSVVINMKLEWTEQYVMVWTCFFIYFLFIYSWWECEEVSFLLLLWVWDLKPEDAWSVYRSEGALSLHLTGRSEQKSWGQTGQSQHQAVRLTRPCSGIYNTVLSSVFAWLCIIGTRFMNVNSFILSALSCLCWWFMCFRLPKNNIHALHV